jgi:hypothetical protein
VIGEDVRLSFRDSGIFFDEPIRPCLDQVTIFRHDAAREEVVWELRAPAGSCAALDKLTVGDVPRGLEEIINRLPLSRSQTYVASAHERDARWGKSGRWTLGMD